MPGPKLYVLVSVSLAAGLMARPALAQQKIVKWNIEATVIQVADPNGLFPDVQLGDPVRGWMSYDRGTDSSPELNEENINIYQTVVGYRGVSMVIENPRGGPDTVFEPDMRPFSGTLVNLANDYLDPDDGLVDWVWVDTSVMPPIGSVSSFADLAVFLYGPGAALPELSLPDELELEDWPHAIIEFRDNFLHQDPTEIIAEIHSLTPVLVTPGDYDSNGVVDAADYTIWRSNFGADSIYLPGVRNGDGNGDSFVDAADYVIWRKNLEQAVGVSSVLNANAAVPEPTFFAIFNVGSLIACSLRRRASVL